MTLNESIQQLVQLAVSDYGRTEAGFVLREAFPQVPHWHDDIFLPGYVVRRILQSPELLALEEAAQWRLADWASHSVVDYMGQVPAGKPGKALATALGEAGLGMKAVRVLCDVLEDLRDADPTTERIFRLLYFAGKELSATAAWLLRTDGEFTRCCRQKAGDDDMELMEEAGDNLVAEACRGVEEIVDAELAATEPGWSLQKLHQAGIRPPGRTTRILDGIRAGNLRFWDAATNEEFYNTLPKALREGSLMSEFILNTKHGPKSLPEDSRRLKIYVLNSLKNLHLGRCQAEDEKIVPLDGFNDEGESYDKSAETRSEDWLFGGLIAHRAEDVDRGDVGAGEFDMFGGLIAHRAEDVVEKFRRVEEMFHQDRSELVRTYEVCYLDPDTTGLPRTEHARLLEITPSTVTRRRKQIAEYFFEKLAVEGLDLDHYQCSQFSKQIDDLYDLVEKFFSSRLTMNKGAERRRALVEAIENLAADKPASHQLLKERYFDETLPSDMAKRRGLKTEELQAQLKLAQQELAERILGADEGKRTVLAGIRDHFCAESPSLALALDLHYRACPALKREDLALVYGIGKAAVHLQDRQIQGRLASRLEEFGFTFKDFRQRLPDSRLHDLLASVSQLLSSEFALNPDAGPTRHAILVTIGELGGKQFLQQVLDTGHDPEVGASDVHNLARAVAERIADGRGSSRAAPGGVAS